MQKSILIKYQKFVVPVRYSISKDCKPAKSKRKKLKLNAIKITKGCFIFISMRGSAKTIFPV
jgi:hypothetical protein